MLSSQSHKVTHTYSMKVHIHKKTQACNTFIQKDALFQSIIPLSILSFISVTPLFSLTYSLCLLCLGLYVYTTFIPHLPFSYFLFLHFFPGQQHCHCLLKNLTLSHRYFVRYVCVYIVRYISLKIHLKCNVVDAQVIVLDVCRQ